MDDLFKCERCNVYIGHWHIKLRYSRIMSRQMCSRCWREWIDSGYHGIWWSFYDNNNFELANKLVLDFLGKLD